MKSKFLFLFSFIISFFLISSCQKIDFPNNTIKKTQPPVFRGYWIEGEFDGVFKVMEQFQDDFLLTHENDGEIGSTDCTFSYQSCLKQGESIFEDELDYGDVFCIEFIDFFQDECKYEWLYFPLLFDVESVPYAEDLFSYGVSISFTDSKTKKSWGTHLGPQENSSFTITEGYTQVFDFEGLPHHMIKGEFSCTLYSNQGEKMEVTNATYWLMFAPVQ